MEVKINEKEIADISGVPRAPPPPILKNKIPLNQGKDLTKSAATLLGKGNDKVARELALNVCQNFLHRYKVEDNISWFYHNNDVEACLQDGPT